MSENENLPELRFPGFKDAWEVKRLGEVASAVFDGTHQTPQYTEVGIPFFSVENIISGAKNKYISYIDYQSATSKNKPEKGDVLITRIGSIGFSVVVNWDYEFGIYVTLAAIKKSNKFNSYYLSSYFSSLQGKREIMKRSLLSAIPCKINMNELRAVSVSLPALAEQQKIAACLSSLDEVITACQGKLETLKEHKKGLMQKLFPREGKRVSELRFREFKDEWEVKRLCSIVQSISNGLSLTQNSNNEGFRFTRIETIAHGTVDLNKVGYIEVENDISDYRLKIGDILISNINSISHIGKSAIIERDYDLYHGMNLLRIEILNEVISPKFLYYWLNTVTVRASIRSRACRAVNQASINQKELGKTNIPFPALAEQQKIAACLSSLDEIITACQDKLEALKEHKKGLMQKLFPKNAG